MKISIKITTVLLSFCSFLVSTAQSDINLKLTKKEAKKVETLDTKNSLSITKYYLSSRILNNTNYEFVLTPDNTTSIINEFLQKEGKVIEVVILKESKKKEVNGKMLKYIELKAILEINGDKQEIINKLTLELIQEEWFILDVPF